MVEERRVIQNREKHYEYCYKVLLKDQTILQPNKDLILKFLERQQDNNVKLSRRVKVLMQLTRLARWLDKPLNEVTEEDVRVFKRKLMGNELQKEKRKLVHKVGENGLSSITGYEVIGHENYSESYKWDFLKVLKKFYKDMFGNGEYPDCVKWMDIKHDLTEIPALTSEEVEKMASYSGHTRYKALIKFLFDSGARIEEALNVKLSDLKIQDGDDPRYEPKPYSAELMKDDYYMVRIRISKTKARTLSLSLCSKELKEWLSAHPEKNNPDAYLFISRLNKPLEYSACRNYLKRLGEKILNKKVSPHLFRHSSATYYANKLSYFPFCKRYGWSLSSHQPQRYIDKSGLEEKETAKIMKDSSVSQLKRENDDMKNELLVMKDQMKKLQEVFASKEVQKLIRVLPKEMLMKR